TRASRGGWRSLGYARRTLRTRSCRSHTERRVCAPDPRGIFILLDCKAIQGGLFVRRGNATAPWVDSLTPRRSSELCIAQVEFKQVAQHDTTGDLLCHCSFPFISTITPPRPWIRGCWRPCSPT